MTPADAIKARGKRTQADLARAMGVSVQTIQRFEYGTRPMTGWYELALSALGKPAPKGWRVVVIDLRAGHATYVTTKPDSYTAADYIASQYPHARVVPETTGATLYALLPAQAIDDGAPRAGVDFILPTQSKT